MEMTPKQILHDLFPNNWYFAYMRDLEKFYKEQDDARKLQIWQQHAADKAAHAARAAADMDA
jgi:hypothetical protein